MNTQHTPGPWNYSGPCEITGRYSIFHNGPLAYCADTTAKPGDGEANARLIAAAPDLLAVLQEAVKVLDYAAFALDAPEASHFRATIADARAAIAKATGGAA